MASFKDGYPYLRLDRVFLLVIMGGYLCREARGDCPCHNYKQRMYNTSDNICSGLSRKINCCPSQVLGFDDPYASVQWQFNGNPLEIKDEWKELICENQTLYNKRAEMSDEGNYTCVVTSSNGTVRTLTTFLDVHESNGFLEGPKDVKAPGEVCSWKGSVVNFTCGGMVGKPGLCHSGGSIQWLRITENGDYDILPNDVNISTSRIDDDGTIRSTLVFSSVESKHFGKYVCNVKNMYRSNVRNISLIEGDPEYCGTVNFSKMSVAVIAAAACIILGVPCLWWRFRTSVRLLHKERKHKTFARDGFLYDVFIVHGDEASSWVVEVLVKTLEDSFGYTCFVPHRNMLGGEQFAEAISDKMKKSRKVLVVITPCLLQSQWAFWSATNGIDTCFKYSSILGIVLQDFGNDALSSETMGLLKTLKPIPRQKVPKVCMLKEDIKTINKNKYNDSIGQYLSGNFSAPSNKDSLSPSSNNQRLSNIITGSNNASKETLNEVNDYQKDCHKKDAKAPVIYVEDVDSMKDPGSPCSITPFIMPVCKSSRNRMQNPKPCFSFISCLRSVFIGDPETVFWQKIRLFLDPPTERRKITIESTA